MANNTLNPVPSSDPRDLFDNATTIDLIINSGADRIPGRFGQMLYTWGYFHRLVETAVIQIDGVITSATSQVNARRDSGIADINQSVAAVDAAEAEAKADMLATAAAIGDDLNNKRYASYAAMNADPQTRDAVVAVVDGDQDPNLNGWYAWNNTTKAWLRFLNQPANSATVDARFYRTENQLSGASELVLDGAILQALPSDNPNAVIQLIDGSPVGRIDTQRRKHFFDLEITKKSEVLEGDSGHVDRSNFPAYETLPDSPNALTYLCKDGTVALSIDTVGKKITSCLDIESSLEARPTWVFVDSPARIERNTQDPVYRLADRNYQATATIAKTGTSRFWAAWRAENKEIDPGQVTSEPGEGPGNFAVLAYSDDDCVSVKEYGYLTYSPAFPGNQIVDPMLWTDPDGRLWLFHGVIGNNQHYDGVGGAWAVICQNPNAEFPVWGQPFRLSYFGDPRRPVEVNGKWYIALDGWRFNALEPPLYMDHVGPHIYEIDWRGQKLKHIAQLPPNNNGQYSGFFETEFVQRSDGSVLALLRWGVANEPSQVQYSVSKDLMKTWTPWQDYTAAVPSSSSRMWLGRSSSGRVLLCWNNDGVRRTLTVGLSDDEGQTYAYKKVVEPDTNIQVSYPIVAFGEAGAIYVIYDNGRVTNKQIRISKVFEQDIVSGTSTPRVSVVSDPANP